MNAFQQMMQKHQIDIILLSDYRKKYANNIRSLGIEKYNSLICAISHAEYVLSLCNSPAQYLKNSSAIICATAKFLSDIEDGEAFTKALLKQDANGEYIYKDIIPVEMRGEYIIRTPRQIAECGEDALSRALNCFEDEIVECAYDFLNSSEDDFDEILSPASSKSVCEEWEKDEEGDAPTDYIDLLSCANIIRALNYINETQE